MRFALIGLPNICLEEDRAVRPTVLFPASCFSLSSSESCCCFVICRWFVYAFVSRNTEPVPLEVAEAGLPLAALLGLLLLPLAIPDMLSERRSKPGCPYERRATRLDKDGSLGLSSNDSPTSSSFGDARMDCRLIAPLLCCLGGGGGGMSCGLTCGDVAGDIASIDKLSILLRPCRPSFILELGATTRGRGGGGDGGSVSVDETVKSPWLNE